MDFATDGICLEKALFAQDDIGRAQADLLGVARLLTGREFGSLDQAWNHIRATDRSVGSLLYNAGKLCPNVHALASNPQVIEKVKSLGMIAPAIVDVNFRIDSMGEEQYLFGWHQDYWFSICSVNAVVAWIPLTSLDDQTGGVELVSAQCTENRILGARKGDVYRSYADAAVLDGPVPDWPKVDFSMNRGDALFFRFNVLHRSKPVLVDDRSRWTLQVRYADFGDKEFFERRYKPASVTQEGVPYFGKGD